MITGQQKRAILEAADPELWVWGDNAAALHRRFQAAGLPQVFKTYEEAEAAKPEGGNILEYRNLFYVSAYKGTIKKYVQLITYSTREGVTVTVPYSSAHAHPIKKHVDDGNQR